MGSIFEYQASSSLYKQGHKWLDRRHTWTCSKAACKPIWRSTVRRTCNSHRSNMVSTTQFSFRRSNPLNTLDTWLWRSHHPWHRSCKRSLSERLGQLILSWSLNISISQLLRQILSCSLTRTTYNGMYQWQDCLKWFSHTRCSQSSFWLRLVAPRRFWLG